MRGPSDSEITCVATGAISLWLHCLLGRRVFLLAPQTTRCGGSYYNRFRRQYRHGLGGSWCGRQGSLLAYTHGFCRASPGVYYEQLAWNHKENWSLQQALQPHSERP